MESCGKRPHRSFAELRNARCNPSMVSATGKSRSDRRGTIAQITINLASGENFQWPPEKTHESDVIDSIALSLELVKAALSSMALDLASVRSEIPNILRGMSVMSAELDALTAQVATNGTVIDSAIVLINGIAAQIAAAVAAAPPGTDPALLASLTTLSSDLGTKDAALAAAVTANTPAAAPPVEPPPVEPAPPAA